MLCFWKSGELPGNKHSLLSLLQLIHELDIANMKSVRGNPFFHKKLSAFDIYFSKNKQMLEIISERGKIFQVIFSYFFSKNVHPCKVFLILGFWRCCLFLVFYYYMLKSKEKISFKTKTNVIAGTVKPKGWAKEV